MNSNKPRLRVVYAGTPEFACRPLQALFDSQMFDLVAVYTQPDRRRGRGKKLSPSPVKALAEQLSIPVLQPVNFKNSNELEALGKLTADIMVVAAYGLILPQAVLDAPRLGCLNIHASLLPRWRGAAPVERAIQAGDSETGVTIMQMDAGLDTGDILLKKSCQINAIDTGDSVREKLSQLGSAAILEALDLAASQDLNPEAQNDTLSTYAAKVVKPDCELHWQLGMEELERTIRAFSSAYTCYTTFNGERVKIGSAKQAGNSSPASDTAPGTNPGTIPGTIIGHEKESILVACGSGALALTRLQLPGARMLSARDLLNSRAEMFAVGRVFGA